MLQGFLELCFSLHPPGDELANMSPPPWRNYFGEIWGLGIYLFPWGLPPPNQPDTPNKNDYTMGVSEISSLKQNSCQTENGWFGRPFPSVSFHKMRHTIMGERVTIDKFHKKKPFQFWTMGLTIILDSHRSWNLPWELHPPGCSLTLQKKKSALGLSGAVLLTDSLVFTCWGKHHHQLFNYLFVISCLLSVFDFCGSLFFICHTQMLHVCLITFIIQT